MEDRAGKRRPKIKRPRHDGTNEITRPARTSISNFSSTLGVTMTTLAEPTTTKVSPEYSKLSPFELKDLLIGMADEASKTRAAVMLNAGRGNPNWIPTTPREALPPMLTLGRAEARGSRGAPGVGLSGMPNSPGIAARFEEYLFGIPGPGGVLLRRTL